MIIIVETIYTDDCTYSNYEYIPIEYESSEAAIVDFEIAVKDTLKTGNSWDDKSFKFSNYTFRADDYAYELSDGEYNYSPPVFYTLKEWLSRYGIN